MNMHNPPHPGAFIKATYLDPFGLSVRYLASKLEVAVSTIHRIINCQSAISPEMAHRLSAVLGRTPESWLALQAQYDLWHVKQHKLKKINFDKFEDAA
ncbi:MAG: HigA family addiction module antitoxin [Gammaproteobacteria bacterium]|nr:HigA family addiction module antitoxin [Gammaproteobacteria bacterium]